MVAAGFMVDLTTGDEVTMAVAIVIATAAGSIIVIVIVIVIVTVAAAAAVIVIVIMVAIVTVVVIAATATGDPITVEMGVVIEAVSTDAELYVVSVNTQPFSAFSVPAPVSSAIPTSEAVNGGHFVATFLMRNCHNGDGTVDRHHSVLATPATPRRKLHDYTNPVVGWLAPAPHLPSRTA